MPTYDFINNHTGEEWTEMMSIADMESLVEGNPEIKQAWKTAPMIAGDHIMGVGRCYLLRGAHQRVTIVNC